MRYWGNGGGSVKRFFFRLPVYAVSETDVGDVGRVLPQHDDVWGDDRASSWCRVLGRCQENNKNYSRQLWRHAYVFLSTIRRQVLLVEAIQANFHRRVNEAPNCFLSANHVKKPSIELKWWMMVAARTLWEPVYDIIVLRFRPKNISFRLPYQRPSSSADC